MMMSDATIHDGYTGEEITMEHAVRRMVAMSMLAERRFIRLVPGDAAEPFAGMRIYGRSPQGRIGVIVVHSVKDGEVFYAQRQRGWYGGPWRGFRLYRGSLEQWRSESLSRVAAVRMQVPLPDPAARHA
jgi:hypothetical protein